MAFDLGQLKYKIFGDTAQFDKSLKESSKKL
jgi:hypothetical protein